MDSNNSYIDITKIEKLEKNIHYTFKDKKVVTLALMHSSFGNDNRLGKYHNNERLEFLGDAVLELSTSEFLFDEYGDKPEGELTRLRASIVCEPTLAECARMINLPDFILLGKGEEMTGGRSRDSIVSDAFEAVIGAIYRDGGFEAAKAFVQEFVLNDIEHKHLFYDSKTILQEIVQKELKQTVAYELTGEEGPDHNKTFMVDAKVGDKVVGSGVGPTKRKAEQKAAYEAILSIKNRGL